MKNSKSLCFWFLKQIFGPKGVLIVLTFQQNVTYVLKKFAELQMFRSFLHRQKRPNKANWLLTSIYGRGQNKRWKENWIQ